MKKPQKFQVSELPGLAGIFEELKPFGTFGVPADRLERHCQRLVRWAEKTRPDALPHQVVIAFRHYKHKLRGEKYVPFAQRYGNDK